MIEHRLLAGWRAGGALSLADHLAAYGELGPVARDPEAILALAEVAGIRGRGGAGFPLGRKLRAVAEGRGPKVVVANGAEGEPSSAKDRLLLESLPHLVLDGVELAATATRADEAFVCVSSTLTDALSAVGAALGERRGAVPIELVAVPDRYVAGEESALVHSLNGGPPAPTAVPPRPFERGVRRRPTLVSNVETLAHLALAARYGETWFRSTGTPADAGTTLLTVSGAVERPGVYEIALGGTLHRLVELAGPTAAPRAFLLGGLFGSWVAPGDAVAVPLAHGALHGLGASLGCGVVVALPEGACGVCETAGAIEYLARESAGQCGPCTFGLRAIADALGQLAVGRAPSGTLARLERWADDVEGRGACHHPDGAVRLLRSALDVFADEAAEHARGRRCASGGRPRHLHLPAASERIAA